jgi:hypothetical protein
MKAGNEYFTNTFFATFESGYKLLDPFWGNSHFVFCDPFEGTIYGARIFIFDRLCGLVATVSGYRSRDPGFDSGRTQIFWEAVGLERGPLSLVSITEELLERNSNGSGQENRY